MASESDIFTIAAIPATFLIIVNAVQGTAQAMTATSITPDVAERRITEIAWFAGGTILVAAGAASIKTHNIMPLVATGITVAALIYAFNRITFGKGFGRGLPDDGQ